MKDSPVGGKKRNQFFSIEDRVEEGLRVSSVRVEYDWRGPMEGKFGEPVRSGSRAGWTVRRSRSQSPKQA